MSTTTDAASAPPDEPRSKHRGAQALLLAAAALQLYDGGRDLAALLGDPSEVVGHDLGGLAITASVAVRPVVALAVLLLALAGRIVGALLAMAALIVVGWLWFLPSGPGLSLGLDDLGSVVSIYVLIAPFLAVVVAALAWRGARPGLAAILATAPTFVGTLWIAAFAIAVAIHEF